MKRPVTRLLALATLTIACWLLAVPAVADIPIKNICRVKGQEENSLRGIGIVTGLKGTGDGGDFTATIRALARAMEWMGHAPLTGLDELKSTKNVALVDVTVTVPGEGTREGSRLDCIVSSHGTAKSLEGGHLFYTLLLGPDRNNPQVFASAEGLLQLDDPEFPTIARISRGCRMETDIINPFEQDGKITLVLDEAHADFKVAQDVAEQINSTVGFQLSGGLDDLAIAKNAGTIVVTIPSQYRDNPVLFVSQVLDSPRLMVAEPGARVTINERAGTIIFSADVPIGPAVIHHKTIQIQTGVAPGDRFLAVDPAETSQATLEGLLKALNAIHVPNADIIDIIKGLDRNGRLHAQLVFE